MSEGRAVALTRCWIHRGVFECDPEHVCTVYVNGAGNIVDNGTPGAKQVDLCDPCIELVNKRRVANGLAPFETAADHAARLS